MKRMRSKEEIVGIVNEGIEKGEIDAGGTEVVANPTLAGTESALTGLQVGDTKYKVEAGGGQLYLHSCLLSSFLAIEQAIVNLVLPSATPLTVAALADFLKSNGYNSTSNPFRNLCKASTARVALFSASTDSLTYAIMSYIYSDNGTTIKFQRQLYRYQFTIVDNAINISYPSSPTSEDSGAISTINDIVTPIE